jgi:hypothetical protein
MKRVHIRRDPFDQKTWTSAEVDDVCAYLATQFEVFPENARIYHQAVSHSNDVTPASELAIQQLQVLDGDIYVVVWPAYDPVTIAYLVIAAITLIFSVYTYMTMPKPQVSAAQSANNDLAERQNRARMNGRVPDIFGNLRSTPDLIAPSYTYYDANDREIEENLMVIGRGYYQIHDCRDDLTLVQDIQGASVSVFDPSVSIIGTPKFKIGEAFAEPPTLAFKSKSINGQTLNMPNDQKLESDSIYFVYPNIIKTSNPAYNLASMFLVNDSIGVYGAEFVVNDVNLSGAVTFKSTRVLVVSSAIDIESAEAFKGVQVTAALIPIVSEILPVPPETDSTYVTNYRDLSGQYAVSEVIKTEVSGGFKYEIKLSSASQTNPNWVYISEDHTVNAGIVLNKNASAMNLNGTYIVSEVSANTVTLNNPNLVNDDWDKLILQPNNSTASQPLQIRLDRVSERWVGWFNIAIDGTEQLVFNFFFQNGLFYQDSKGGVWADSMTVVIEYQYLDADNTPFGPTYTEYVQMSASNKSPFGRTKKIDLDNVGRVRFRVARTTPTKNDKTQDLCKIKDVYAIQKSTKLIYPGVTVVRSKTLGTDGALSLKERKLNFLVTRMLKLNGTGALTATKSAVQALIHCALDEFIGRRSQYEVDTQQILGQEQTVISYFGNVAASEFSGTLDDSNLSFEETAGMLASAMFCEAHRFGSKLQINFEKPQENAVLLFNHRNKVPKTEKRSFSLGVKNAYDGVQLEYTSPEDDARVKYVASDSESPKNVKEIKSSGIRNDSQAKTRAWREWNKIKHQHISCKFDALDESEILRRNDKILVANQTRTDTQDGEVLAVDGLMLKLSQNVEFNAGEIYFIYLQMPDGSVDSIQIAPGAMTNEVILLRAPVQPLIVDKDRYLKTAYIVMRAEDEACSAFMMTELKPQGKMTNSLMCVNYSSRYYEKDHDFF